MSVLRVLNVAALYWEARQRVFRVSRLFSEAMANYHFFQDELVPS